MLKATQELVTLDYMMDEISERLDEYEGWSDENWENFVAKLLYMHIPREVLWRFISGIAFYEAVSVRQKSESMPAVENVRTQQNVNLHFELFNNKETNIDKNYGPNIEQNGGTLSLPETKVAGQ